MRKTEFAGGPAKSRKSQQGGNGCDSWERGGNGPQNLWQEQVIDLFPRVSGTLTTQADTDSLSIGAKRPLSVQAGAPSHTGVRTDIGGRLPNEMFSVV